MDKEEVLLEEYKNCTQVYLNESRLFWTRYGIYLAISSALLTVWSYLEQLNRTLALGAALFGIGLIGLLLSVVWFFVIGRGNALSDLWQKRLRKIEDDLKLENNRILKTFDKAREKEHFDGESFLGRRRLRYSSFIPPSLFLTAWLVFSVISFVDLIKLSTGTP